METTASARAVLALKYGVYALLCLNVYLFLREEAGALGHTIDSAALDAGALVRVFASTIDTAAWLVLLLLFEFETAVARGRAMRPGMRGMVHAVRGLCALAIVYAFAGYCAQLAGLLDARAAGFSDACARLGEGWSVLLGMNRYAPLDAANCAALGAAPLQVGGYDVLADTETLRAVRRLSLTDVINAGAWILVVLVLEIEVRLQLAQQLSARWLHLAGACKLLLYTVLVLALAYWAWRGDLLDIWDAGLWLFAFLFIELNVLGWHAYEQAGDGR